TALAANLNPNRGAVARTERRIARAEAALARRSDTAGDKFAMTVAGAEYFKRPDAGGQLKIVAAQAIESARRGVGQPWHEVAHLGGLPIELMSGHDSTTSYVTFRVVDLAGTDVSLTAIDLKAI